MPLLGTAFWKNIAHLLRRGRAKSHFTPKATISQPEQPRLEAKKWHWVPRKSGFGMKLFSLVTLNSAAHFELPAQPLLKLAQTARHLSDSIRDVLTTMTMRVGDWLPTALTNHRRSGRRRRRRLTCEREEESEISDEISRSLPLEELRGEGLLALSFAEKFPFWTCYLPKLWGKLRTDWGWLLQISETPGHMYVR